MNAYYLAILISTAIAAGGGLLAPDVLDLVSRSQHAVEQVDAMNRAQVIEAASIFFLADLGRAPAGAQELVDRGYLKPDILQ